MKVCVPQTALQPATALYLDELTALYPDRFTVEHVRVRNRWGYIEHFEHRWALGEDFINLEHDVVPWPGAMHGLDDCEQPWCFHTYVHGIDSVANGGAVFGLVRFRAEIIAALPRVWHGLRSRYGVHPQPWRYCDVYFFNYAREHGFTPHQHHPAVFHAHPAAVSPPASSLKK